MTNPTIEKYRAVAATSLACGMEAAADQGVPDAVIAEEMVRITLALIAQARGGEAGLADWLEAEAHRIRNRGNAELQPDKLN